MEKSEWLGKVTKNEDGSREEIAYMELNGNLLYIYTCLNESETSCEFKALIIDTSAPSKETKYYYKNVLIGFPDDLVRRVNDFVKSKVCELELIAKEEDIK